MDDSSLDKMSAAFDTTFSAANVESDVALIESKKNELLDKIKSKSTDLLKDQDYLDFEMKSLISDSKSVLMKLESDIRIGANARQFEVYAKLTDSIMNSINSLVNMNKMLWDMDRAENKPNKPQEASFVFDSNQLLSFVHNIQKNNSLNEVDANFKILPDKD